jgi:hypothetical protein
MRLAAESFILLPCQENGAGMIFQSGGHFRLRDPEFAPCRRWRGIIGLRGGGRQQE